MLVSPLTLRWLLLAAAIAAEVAATLCLKAALDAPWLYVVVVVGYVSAFVLLSRVLKLGMGLGVAYGVWGAIGVVLTAVLSTLLFKEPLTVLMAIGFAIIIGGVLCIELGSQRAHRGEAAPAHGDAVHPDAPGRLAYDGPRGTDGAGGTDGEVR